jgi:hypothetical protein
LREPVEPHSHFDKLRANGFVINLDGFRYIRATTRDCPYGKSLTVGSEIVGWVRFFLQGKKT